MEMRIYEASCPVCGRMLCSIETDARINLKCSKCKSFCRVERIKNMVSIYIQELDYLTTKRKSKTISAEMVLEDN